MFGQTAAFGANGSATRSRYSRKGLCATAGAELQGARFIIAVESDVNRAAMAKRMGADVLIEHTQMDAVEEIRRLTNGKSVDVAIEAPGPQATFESALPSLRAAPFQAWALIRESCLCRCSRSRRIGRSQNRDNVVPGRERACPVDGTAAARAVGICVRC